MNTTHNINSNLVEGELSEERGGTSAPVSKRRTGRIGVAPFVVFLCLPALTATAQDESTTRPPITQQAPLPSPSLPLPKANKPLSASPGEEALRGRLQSQPLTINDVVAIALATNRTLATAVEAFWQSQGVTTTARAGLNPSLSASYSLTRYNQEQVSNLGGQSLVIQQQYVNQLNAGLNLPVDITGELHAAVNQAKFQQLAAGLEVNRVRNQIVLDAKNAFYAVLRDQALVTVAEGNLQNAVDRLADAQLRLSAGTVAHFDVTRAQTDVASAQQILIKNRSALSQAFAQINSTIGLNIDTAYQLTTKSAVEVPPGAAGGASNYVLPNVKPSPPPENSLNGQKGQALGDQGATQAAQVQDFVVGNPISPGADYENILKEALRTRPEILREDANIAAARKGIVVARAGQLPSVSIGYNVNYAPNSGTLAGQVLSGYAGLTLSVPLYDGGATRGKVMQAKALVSRAETARREQIDAVTLDVRITYLNLQQTEQAIAAARQELAQADESYRLARLRYSAGVTSQSGVSPLIELSNAQQALSQAQNDYVNALYDYNNNRSALDKAVGRYSYMPLSKGLASQPAAADGFNK